jgi:hypothetical protein
MFFVGVGLTATLCRAQRSPQMVASPDKASGVSQVGDTVHWTVEWKGDNPAPATRYILKSGGLQEVGQGDLTFNRKMATLDTKFNTLNTMLLEVK